MYSELYSAKLDVKKLKRCLAATGVEMVRASYIYISYHIHVYIFIVCSSAPS